LAGIEASVIPGLDTLARAYTRLAADVQARLNFACDSNSDTAFATAEQEQAYLDQAFFVLSFAKLEKQLYFLAGMRMSSDQRLALREQKFERRLEVAIRVATETLGTAPEWCAASSTIEGWYTIRNNIAHGDVPASIANIVAVLTMANVVAQTLENCHAKIAKA
jgi:hypothetical protein